LSAEPEEKIKFQILYAIAQAWEGELYEMDKFYSSYSHNGEFKDFSDELKNYVGKFEGTCQALRLWNNAHVFQKSTSPVTYETFMLGRAA